MRVLTAMPIVPGTSSATEVAENLRLARRAEGPAIVSHAKAQAGVVRETDTIAPELASVEGRLDLTTCDDRGDRVGKLNAS